jgi:hypothetical protein
MDSTQLAANLPRQRARSVQTRHFASRATRRVKTNEVHTPIHFAENIKEREHAEEGILTNSYVDAPDGSNAVDPADNIS